MPDPTMDTVGRSGAVVARFRTMSTASGWSTLSVGAIVCIGWLFDIPLLKSIFPHFPTMKANTAVGFMVAGVALIRLQARRVPCRSGQACATMVTLLGVLTLGQYALGWDLGIDQIFFKDAGDAIATSTPGRMSVLTALNFLCFGVALLLRGVRTPQGPQPAEYLALTGLLMSLLALMQYIYSTETFATFAPDFSSIALHTVVTFLILGSGILLARPDHGMMAILSSATDGGLMGRRLLPATPILFVMLSWLEQRGLHAGLYSEHFGLAMLTVSLVALFVFLILLNASSLHRVALQRHQTEVALRESDERLRTIVAAMPIPLSISRLSDGLILYANAHYSTLVALPMDAVVGRKTMDFYFDPDDRQRLLEALHRDGSLHNYELHIKAANGASAWVASSCQRTTFNCEPVLVNGFYDITERKRMEEALQHSETQLKDLIKNIPAVVHLKSVEGRYLLVNAQFERLYNTTSAQLLGKTAYDILPQDVADVLQTIDTQILQSRQMAQAEVSVPRSDGLHTYLSRKFLLLDAAGEPYAICGISIDITERKRAEEALQSSAADLARSNAELEQFAYVASHDLQEPLRAVAGCMQLFQQRYAGRLDARADELIAHAIDGAVRMRMLITDLLDYSRVTTHGTSFAPVDCTTVLDQALANLHVALTESGAVVTPDPLPTVPADATQLLQLLQNLLSNAIKFRTEQPPEIHVGVERQAGTWLFSVRDNGIGIEPQYAERIFGLFQRLHTRKEYPGTGIGLALCKKIVERQGGRMWVASALGQGATFYFTLHAMP